MTLGIAVDRAWAFIRRDFLIETSYKFQFVFRLSSGFFEVLTFYFVAQLVTGEQARPGLLKYDTDYFSFVLVGITAGGFLHTGLSGFARRLRTEMAEGSLTYMFATPTRPSWIFLLPCLWSFGFEVLRAAIVIAIGVLVFGGDLAVPSVLAAGGMILLAVTSYSAIGLLSAAVIMIIKRGDPVNWAFAQLSAIVAGAYFPIELLPPWLEAISKALPMTYVHNGLRMVLLRGSGVADITTDLLFLSLFSLVSLPLALAVIRFSVERAKREGTLGTF